MFNQDAAAAVYIAVYNAERSKTDSDPSKSREAAAAAVEEFRSKVITD